MKLAFLGLGKMGTPMVRRLLAAGHEVTVWNRTRSSAEALVSEGARVASTPAEAIHAQDAILSSLKDDATHEELFFGANPIIDAIASGQLHISLSTISVPLSRRFTEEHAKRGQLFVGAPVFGRPNVAADGRLWIAAAGSDDAVAKARPLLEPLSRGITVVGTEPWQAHALKLGGNFMIASMIQTLSEAMAFATSQGIDPETFVTTVNSALFQSPFYEAYAKVMLHPPEQPGATIQLGAKDTRLFREAGHAAGFDSGLGAYLAAQLDQTIAAGLGESDWPVSQYQIAQKQVAPKS
ncbi:MAG TPA: NAD(P)-dependent oxidoreductase [Acidobacteriaceae bacterium]|jgi:3-hydroxyisobutyrate dehydrogenase-like beta-hydroxyacid dehydrogenase|nr:NAD(P)-dependent oxidoreductase [Acidobacteriaceae bacterium]